MTPTTDNIREILRTIIHPIKNENILKLGLVEDIRVEDSRIRFKLVFPAPDPVASDIKKVATEALNKVFPEAKISITELVRDRKKAHNVNELGQDQIENIDKIIAIASGKGGVGKSTVTVNLAYTLSQQGYKVGVIDADIYGPSIPIMTGTEGQMPEVIPSPSGEEGKELIVPIEKFGVKWISIGYFVAPEQALIWRGPMAVSALKQLVFQVAWGDLDYLLIDLPPGTGDIHISMIQEIPLTGAIIITTPQTVALADVRKGVEMFRNKDINVPVLGLVENMAWFTPAELPDNKYYIFGREGGKKMAQALNIPLLAQIPLIQSVREGGDTGQPTVLPGDWEL